MFQINPDELNKIVHNILKTIYKLNELEKHTSDPEIPAKLVMLEKILLDIRTELMNTTLKKEDD